MSKTDRPIADRAFIAGMCHVSQDVRNLDDDSPFLDTSLEASRHQWDESRLYHEAHVTVQPGLIEVEEFRRLFGSGLWRFSVFQTDDVDHVQGMWFISCRQQSLSAIREMVATMVESLRTAGLTVLRAKIEDTILDTKYGDVLTTRVTEPA